MSIRTVKNCLIAGIGKSIYLVMLLLRYNSVNVCVSDGGSHGSLLFEILKAGFCFHPVDRYIPIRPQYMDNTPVSKVAFIKEEKFLIHLRFCRKYKPIIFNFLLNSFSKYFSNFRR